MLATAFSALVLLFAVQGLLVVKLADKLTADAATTREGILPAGGRYAGQAA